ncbi:MAG: ATP-binding protein [Bacillota bacterium]|nr:ATP-binding protein [Bacillota bacterium]
MFKSIFSKLIVLFISIIIISFSITGIMLYYMLDRFVYSEKESILKRGGEIISNSLYTYIENSNTNMQLFARQNLESNMEYIMEQTHSYVWIINPQGYIGFAKPETDNQYIPKQLRNKLISDSGIPRLPDEKQYRKVMLSGNDVVEKGDLYGLFQDSRLTIEKPLKMKDESGKEKIVAAVLLTTSMPDVYQLQRSIIGFYLYSVGISILVVIILAYVFSRRISKPLKEINEAARIIAGGEFEKRLNIKSRDEIGELAVSFNNMVDGLQNLEEMRRGFIANVSHELRTPMTSIRGFIEGILDGTIPFERQNNYLAIVRDEVTRMNRLVNDLLDLARMEAGEVKLNLIDFNINELIRRSIIKIESILLSKNINVEAYFEVEELYVNADLDAIERVILNIVHNAVKFTDEGGKIKISAYKKKDKIIIAIEDNGPGISKEEINRIWDRFYKADKSRGRDKSGTGLGLAIVKNIITEHGQEIFVESEPGHGAKFTFTLNKAIDKGIQS